MNRYEIALGKPPPPPRPKKKKLPPLFEVSSIAPSEDPNSFSLIDQIFGEMQVQTTVAPSLISQEQRASIIGSYMATANGRARLAASMANPLRDRVNFRSLARRIFQVDPLDSPNPHLPEYDFNPAGTFVINEQGTATIILQHSIANSRSAYTPLFEVSSNPQIPMVQIRERRYDLIERAQDLAVTEIVRAENERALMILDAVALDCGRNIPVSQDALNTPRSAQDIFRDAFSMINRGELRVTNVLLNALNYATIRNHAFLNRENDPSILREGNLGSLWGARLLVSRVIPPGRIYLTAEPASVGRMPIRTDVTVLASDNPMEHTYDWNIFEMIGFCCNNPFSVMRISL